MVGRVAITAHLIQRFRERIDNTATVEEIEHCMQHALSTLPVFVDLRNNSLIFIGEFKSIFFTIAGKVDKGVVVGVTILDINKFSWGAENLTRKKWSKKEDDILSFLVSCGYNEREISVIMCHKIGKVHERLGNLRSRSY